MNICLCEITIAFMAVMLHGEAIGEIILNNIDYNQKCYTLSIHLQNDNVRVYGIQAEILATQYAFHELGMETVYTDTIHKNRTSQHVLEKIGFRDTIGTIHLSIIVAIGPTG